MWQRFRRLSPITDPFARQMPRTLPVVDPRPIRKVDADTWFAVHTPLLSAGGSRWIYRRAQHRRVNAHAPIRRQGPWRNLETMEFATLTWIDWFNTRRLLEPTGYVPPAELKRATMSRSRVA